jgi:ABC-type transport system substrate-binding protein
VIKDANAEFDLAKRDQLLRRIALFYHEQATSIFLHEQYQLDAISNKVQRWNPVNWYINWHEIEFRG